MGINVNSLIGSGAAVLGAGGIAGFCAYKGVQLCIYVTNKIKSDTISPEAAGTAKKIAFAVGATAVLSLGAPLAIFYSRNVVNAMVWQSVLKDRKPEELIKSAALSGRHSLQMFIAVARNALGMKGLF